MAADLQLRIAVDHEREHDPRTLAGVIGTGGHARALSLDDLRVAITPALQRQESDPLLALFSSASTTPLNVRTFTSTELHLAVAKADTALASRLMAQAQRLSRVHVEALVNQPNEHGWVALHNAAALESEAASVSLLRMLLASGAHPSALDNEGFSALHWAAWVGGGPERIQLLAAAGCGLDLPSRKLGDAPLHRACRAGHAETIRCLVAAGADTCAQNRAFLTPYDVAGARAAGCEGEELLQGELRARALASLTSADPSLKLLILHHDDCLRHVTREGHQVSACSRRSGGGQ